MVFTLGGRLAYYSFASQGGELRTKIVPIKSLTLSLNKSLSADQAVLHGKV
jgi:hypothetical protein